MKDRRSHYKPEAGYARLGSPSTFEDEVIREEVDGGAHHAFCAARLKGGTAEGVRFLVSCCHVAPNFVLKGKKEREASRQVWRVGD